MRDDITTIDLDSLRPTENKEVTPPPPSLPRPQLMKIHLKILLI